MQNKYTFHVGLLEYLLASLRFDQSICIQKQMKHFPLNSVHGKAVLIINVDFFLNFAQVFNQCNYIQLYFVFVLTYFKFVRCEDLNIIKSYIVGVSLENFEFKIWSNERSPRAVHLSCINGTRRLLSLKPHLKSISIVQCFRDRSIFIGGLGPVHVKFSVCENVHVLSYEKINKYYYPISASC